MRWLTAACVKPSTFAAPVKLLNSAAFEKVSRYGSCSSKSFSVSITGHLHSGLQSSYRILTDRMESICGGRLDVLDAPRFEASSRFYTHTGGIAGLSGTRTLRRHRDGRCSRRARQRTLQRRSTAEEFRRGLVITVLQVNHVTLGFKQGEKRDAPGDIRRLGRLHILSGDGENLLVQKPNDPQALAPLLESLLHFKSRLAGLSGILCL